MSAAALKVTTEARPSSRLAVTVTVPGERCKTSYEDAITSLSRSINLPGFRKGQGAAHGAGATAGWRADQSHGPGKTDR